MTAILLTATVAPSVDLANHRQYDPRERLAEYQEALRFYLGVPGLDVRRILFCDNSDHDLSTLARIAAEENPHGRDVRLLSYRSDLPPSLGKGRNEMALIDRAFAEFGDLLGEDEPVWKITGRLKVRNIADLVATQPPGLAVYADFRDVPWVGERLGGNRWVDTRVIAFTKAAHRRYFQGYWERMGATVEKQLFALLAPHLGHDPGLVPRLRRQPVLDGFCAGTSRSYASFGNRAREGLRAATRRVAPGLWL